MAATGKRKRNQGSALIYVLCVMAVVLVLCLSLLLLSFSLYKSALTYKNQEQCQILAVSLSEEIGEELENNGDSWYIPYIGGIVETSGIRSVDVNGVKQDTETASELVAFITENIWTDSWPYYSEDEVDDRQHNKKSAARKLQLDADSIGDEVFQKMAGKITVEMYWCSDSETVAGADSVKRDGTPLVITVECEIGRQSSIITRTYELLYNEEKSKPAQGYEVWGWSLTSPEDEGGSQGGDTE